MTAVPAEEGGSPGGENMGTDVLDVDVVAPGAGPDVAGMVRRAAHGTSRRAPQFHSSSASRVTAGATGFLVAEWPGVFRCRC